METIEEILAVHPFFDGLPRNHLATVAGCATNAKFNEGQYLGHRGQDASMFYLIRHGRVLLESDKPGGGVITIDEAGPGEIVGWSWLVEPHIWQFDAHVVEFTRATAVNGRCLRNKCSVNRELGYEILSRVSRIVADRLDATRARLEECLRQQAAG